MKTYRIILFIALQCFVSAISSQDIRDGFRVSITKNMTWFEDVNMGNYKSSPKNKSGKEIGNPSSGFSSKEKLKIIEREFYSEEERNYMLSHYKPRAMVTVRACDGKIVSVLFVFANLTDSSVIDTRKLQRLLEKIMAEITYENLLFNGEKAASGYMMQPIWLFKP